MIRYIQKTLYCYLKTADQWFAIGKKYVITFWIIDDSAFMSHESSYENCTAANVGRVAVFP